MTIIIVVVGGSVALAAMYIRHELRPTPRPRLLGLRAPQPVAAGDGCICGGTIGKTGRTSRRFGELLGCTACARLWTADGRRLMRRRRGSPREPHSTG